VAFKVACFWLWGGALIPFAALGKSLVHLNNGLPFSSLTSQACESA
jgi:hypothetical protein